MELYTFTGDEGKRGTLRVKSDHPINLLPGFHRVIDAMPDSDTVHAFLLVEKIKEEASGGYFYAWYTVDNYSCTADRTAVVARKADSVADVTAIAFTTLTESGAIDDVTAAEHTELFSAWETNVDYTRGNIRRYGDGLFKCLQAHTSQTGWEPDKAPSLWKVIGDPTEEWPEWSQPVCAGDEYGAGDKVTHNGLHWTSDINGNVWEPGVCFWTAVS